MKKIFILWSDYNGVYVERFNTKEKAAKRCAKILTEASEYGARIRAVIEGKELKMETVKVVSKIVLK